MMKQQTTNQLKCRYLIRNKTQKTYKPISQHPHKYIGQASKPRIKQKSTKPTYKEHNFSSNYNHIPTKHLPPILKLNPHKHKTNIKSPNYRKQASKPKIELKSATPTHKKNPNFLKN